MKGNAVAMLTVLVLLSTELLGQTEAVRLVSYQHSVCDEHENMDRIRNRIKELNWVGDTCIYKLSVVQNCCTFSEGYLRVQSDTLFLTTNSKRVEKVMDNGEAALVQEGPCMCNCYFILTFKIIGLNDHKMYSVYFNGDKVEQNFSNYLPAEFSLTEYDTIYKYDNSGFAYKYGIYAKTGKVHFYSKRKPGHIEYKEFFRSGKLKKHCIQSDKSIGKEKINTCMCWTKRGEIKQHH